MSHPPSIHIQNSSNGFEMPRARSYSSTPGGAMPISNAPLDVPPPLPPPRHPNEFDQGRDAAWMFANAAGFNTFSASPHASVKPGSSLLGNFRGPPGRVPQRAMSGDLGGGSLLRRESRPLELGDNGWDEEYVNNGSGVRRPPLSRFTSERLLGQKAVETSSHAFDKQLLSKIGNPNTPTRTTAPSLLSSSAQEGIPSSQAPFGKLHQQLKPLSVPDRLYTSNESPRWPGSGTLSPRELVFRSPIYESASERSARLGSISTVDESIPPSLQHRGSYDHSIYSAESDIGMEENAGGMRNLDINDPSTEEYQASSRARLKRRASSPPSDAQDRATATGAVGGHGGGGSGGGGGGGGGNDLYHRRSTQLLRNSPVSRFHANNANYANYQGSLSSASSLSQRTGSFASSYGLTAASSVTSYSGEQRLSPGALSPSAEAELGAVSPYAASRSLNPSPRGSLSRPGPHHQRGLSETDHPQSRKMSTDNPNPLSPPHSRPGSVSGRLGGSFICDCCPKKPKKFETMEELKSHESEKQYSCLYCPNRFKNKNEAERHQNSLHLRRHSWSCAVLAGVDAAFHPSPAHSAAADVCGYCGEEFPNPPNRELRSDHLNHVHKFGECNQSKKFFRADHFRQHLKHSHAGTSGKWTNMLEQACMKDEPPLAKERMGSIALAVQAGLSPLAPAPGVIDECDES